MSPRRIEPQSYLAILVEAGKAIQDPCIRCCVCANCPFLCEAKRAYNGMQSALIPYYDRKDEKGEEE